MTLFYILKVVRTVLLYLWDATSSLMNTIQHAHVASCVLSKRVEPEFEYEAIWNMTDVVYLGSKHCDFDFKLACIL